MNITSKYNLGDKVYSGMCSWSSVPKTCEHCKGVGLVTVTTALESYEVPCPYCEQDVWGSKAKGYTQEWSYRVYVQSLTIGEVRVEISNTKHEVDYMCYETGIGSGTLHDEKNLYPTYEEAQAHGETQAKLAQIQRDEEAKKQAKRKTTRVRTKKGA